MPKYRTRLDCFKSMRRRHQLESAFFSQSCVRYEDPDLLSDFALVLGRIKIMNHSWPGPTINLFM